MTRYAVRHATVYEYGGDVVHSHHLLHLQPREFAFQRCLEHSLTLDPQPSFSREDVDAFGNPIARLEYDRAHKRLAVTAEMHVEIFPRGVDSLDAAEPWDGLRSRLSYHAVPVAAADLEACRFRMRSTHVTLKQAFEDYAADCFTPGRPVAAACLALMRKIHREFKYVPGSTTNRTSIVEVLKGRRGVCQDFAHFMIGERADRNTILGALLALGGVALISLVGNVRGDVLYVLAALVASASSGYANVYLKRYAHFEPLTTLPPAMLIAGVTMTVFGIPFEHPDWHRATAPASLTALAYLAVCGSGIAFYMNHWLLQRIDSGIMGLSALMIPVLAVIVGAIFGHEHLGIRDLIGAFLVLIGVCLSLFRTTPSEVEITTEPHLAV